LFYLSEFSAVEERAMAVTAKLKVAGRKLEVGAQLVDHINKGIHTGLLAPGGTLVVGRAGDDAETADPVFGIETLKNPGCGANAIFVGAITRRNTASREDGLGKHLTVMERPSSHSGAMLEALAEGKCR
jgi:hypothetical protein